MHTLALSNKTLYNFSVIFSLFGIIKDQTTFRSSVGMPLWNAWSKVFCWEVEIDLLVSEPIMPKMVWLGCDRICYFIKGMYCSFHFFIKAGFDCLPMKICWPRILTVFLVSFLAYWSALTSPSESKESPSSDDNCWSGLTVGPYLFSSQSSSSIYIILFYSIFTSSAFMLVKFRAAFCFFFSALYSVWSEINKSCSAYESVALLLWNLAMGSTIEWFSGNLTALSLSGVLSLFFSSASNPSKNFDSNYCSGWLVVFLSLDKLFCYSSNFIFKFAVCILESISSYSSFLTSIFIFLIWVSLLVSNSIFSCANLLISISRFMIFPLYSSIYELFFISSISSFISLSFRSCSN